MEPLPSKTRNTGRQSLSHAAHDSSLCTKEPRKSGAPFSSLHKRASSKPPLFVKGEVAQSAGRDKPSVHPVYWGKTRIYGAIHCRACVFLGSCTSSKRAETGRQTSEARLPGPPCSFSSSPKISYGHFWGYPCLSTLPVGKPRPPRLAYISAF